MQAEVQFPAHAAVFAAHFTGQRVAVISPHPDDAALSVGGLLWQLREEAQLTLLTIFSRSAWAAPFSPLAGAGAEAVSAERAAEETRYAAVLGAGLDLLGYEDASLRGYDATSERAAAHDRRTWCRDVGSVLATRLAALEPKAVIAPAAIGGHVDHVLVAAIVRVWCAEAGVPLLLYQDLPYATEPALRHASPIGVAQEVDVPIRVDLDAKLANLCLYRSQLDSGTLCAIANHARWVGRGSAAERLWIPPKVPTMI